MTIISNCTASIIKDAALALKQGHLVAFPTETVYGLGADATNEKAVARIYEVKGRPTDHPLIVHISSLELLDKWAREIPEYAIKLARAFWPGPMTLVLKRTELAKDFITGGQDTVAIRVPSHTLANQLLKEFESLGGYGVTAPSANRFGKVSPTNSQAVEEEIGNFLLENDKILDGGQSQIGIESTIVDCTCNVPRILRPGSITLEMVENLLDIQISEFESPNLGIKVPGSFETHYSPNANVLINGEIIQGNGFIALEEIPTPAGAIRLGSPKDNDDYAQILYSALRQADSSGIKTVNIIPPMKQGIGVAINNRILKASKDNKIEINGSALQRGLNLGKTN
jgi:L-threonylcarbamoyladenylate synthase